MAAVTLTILYILNIISRMHRYYQSSRRRLSKTLAEVARDDGAPGRYYRRITTSACQTPIGRFVEHDIPDKPMGSTGMRHRSPDYVGRLWAISYAGLIAAVG